MAPRILILERKDKIECRCCGGDGDRGVDSGRFSDCDLNTEREKRMSSLEWTQVQIRLLDVRFYLTSRIRNCGVSKELRIELLEVLCLVDPDFDYQEFGLVKSTAVSDSLELIHPRDSIGKNSFSFPTPDRTDRQ